MNAIAANPDFAEAVVRKMVFKSAAARAFACAFLEAGLRRPLDAPWFGADDLTGEHDETTPGCVVGSLITSHVIECWYGTRPDEGIFGGRRRSKHANANGRKVSLYVLHSRDQAAALVEEWRGELAEELKPQKELSLI